MTKIDRKAEQIASRCRIAGVDAPRWVRYHLSPLRRLRAAAASIAACRRAEFIAGK